ncbi:MTH938/NDUFAF3 family protein [Rhizorhapis suberifaciens]|nr:MTH938/NDUFAF3 family protein [Rhizorhapis suberifaciens]
MEIRRDAEAPGPVITGFSGTAFRVQDKIFKHGLILTPDAAIDWTAPPLAEISIADLLILFEVEPTPEFLLLGTGSALVHPPRAFVQAVEAMDIGVEAMDSRAAARAWGVLRTEGRLIVGAFLPL